MKVEVPKIQFLRPNKCIDMVQRVLQWEKQERWFGQWSGRFLGIIDWDPNVCKSNRLYVDILWFSFIKLGYIL